MNENYRVWKDIYETVYNTKLVYNYLENTEEAVA